MEIVSIDLIPCVVDLTDQNWKFARARVSRLEGWVLHLEDGDGRIGLGYAHAIPAITGSGAIVQAGLEWLSTGLIGRKPSEVAVIMAEIETDLAFANSAKAAIDMALHDLWARQVGVPLHALLGGAVRSEVNQSRIIPIKPPREMATLAASIVETGYKQIKLKLAGDPETDVKRVSEVRAAIGPDVVMTLDPNQAYDVKSMMTAFARMDQFDIALIEQPLSASDWAGLRHLSQTLPVQIEADESAQTVSDVFKLVSGRFVDVINLKVTKLGGLRNFVAAQKICEAGNVGCRVGATLGPSLIQANALHAAACIADLGFGCETSEHFHLQGDPFTPLVVNDGHLAVPAGNGCGVTYAYS